MTSLVLATLAVVCVDGAAAAEAAAGPLVLDQTFGRHGTDTPRLGPAYTSTEFLSAHVNPDGSVLAARHEGQDGGEAVTVRRYGVGGKPEGTVETDYALSAPEVVDAAGRYLIGAGRNVERLTTDGAPDTTFGKRDSYGRWMSDGLPCRVEAVLPLSSGQVVAGNSECLARLDPSGKLDPSFGDRGTVMLNPLGIKLGHLKLAGIAPGPGGDMILALNRNRPYGYSEGLTEDGSSVVAITPAAGLDPAWGQGGIVDSRMTIGAISAAPDGGVLLAGERWGRRLDEAKEESDALLVRLGPDGAPAAGFGIGGAAALDIGAIDLLHAMSVQPDGGIIVAGAATRLSFVCAEYWEQFCDETPFVARFQADGSLDDAYGADGVAEMSSLTARFAPIDGKGVLGLSPRPGGGVLAWGGAGTNAFMAALDPAGGLDRAFGTAGIVVEQRQGRSGSNAHLLDVDRHGRVLALGGTNSGVTPGANPGAVFRIRRGGGLDRSYGTEGFVRVPGNSRGLAVGPGGDAFVLSGKFVPNLVSHVTSGGRLDPRFGDEGSVPLPSPPPIVRRGKAIPSEFTPGPMVALPDGGVLIGGVSTDRGAGLNVRIAVIKLNAAGRPVPSFGHLGVSILALGRGGSCNLAAMTVGPGGRVLLAGGIRRGRRRTLAVVAIGHDGRQDRGFATSGVATTPLRGESGASAIAVRGGSIFVAGRRRFRNRVGMVLLRFGAGGRLDARFARRVARSLPAPVNRRTVPDPRQVLPVGRDLVLFSDLGSSLTVFSRSGAYRGTISEDPKARPRARTGAAAVQSGKLVTVSNVKVAISRRKFFLRRYLPR